VERYTHLPTKSNQDAIKYARAYFSRHSKYEKLSSGSINIAAKLIPEISPLINNGIQTIPNFWDRKLIEDIYNDVHDAYNQIKNITIRDHSNEEKYEGQQLNREYVKLKFSSLNDLKGRTSGVTLPDPLLKIPSIYKLLLDEKLINLISAYYSAIPKLTFLKVRHAFAHEDYSPKDTQMWHYDAGSFRLLKVLIYLNDVTHKDHGPHEYIRKTHVLNFNDPIYQTVRMEDDFINKNFSSKIHTVLSKKEDLHFVDATGIHRGRQPQKKDRTVIIANFCLHREYGLPFKRIKIKKNDFNNFNEKGRALFDDVLLV
tara:strand:- start:76 stop:1017 length:942 start_codon:yes stop_codon:yes gene_type:complete